MWSEKPMHEPKKMNIINFWVILCIACLAMPAAYAGTIQGVSLLDSPSGETIRIEGDSPLEYQVFDLSGPPRLIISFPGAKFKQNLNPIRSDGGVVSSVFPVDAADGVRLEIGLSSTTAYEVTSNDDDLIIKFAAKSDADSGAVAHAIVSGIHVENKGQATELRLSGSNLKENHNAFLTNNQQTLILDFWGGDAKLTKENYQFSSRYIRAVTVGQAEGRVRFVVDLLPTSDMKYQLDSSDKQLIVRIGRDVGVAKKSAAKITVESVEFQPDDRVGHIMVQTSELNPIVNVHEKDGNIVIDLSNANLAGGQERSQDLRMFPGPVTQVDTYKNGKNVRIVARLRTDVNISTYQHGNVLTVNLEPKDLAKSVVTKDGKSTFAYVGQKVTFNFKDIDIRNALLLIAEMSDKNLIMSDDVTGSLTMRLIDVPWDQALDIIIHAKGFGKQEDGNVVRIAPIAVIESENTARLAARTSAKKLAPLITEFIRLGYASVNDVKALLEGGSIASASTLTDAGALPTEAAGADASSSSGGGAKSSMLSERGSMLLDERSNTLIITDIEERIQSIKRLIAEIDKPIRQVLIAARIVEASDSFSREMGIKWGGTSAVSTNGGLNGTASGASSGTSLVDLPAAVGTGAGGAIGFALANLGGSVNLDLELSAAEADGQAKIVSNPRVLTSNLQEALIEDSQQIPFAGESQGGGVTSTSKEAKLALKVKPQITADNRIILELEVNKDTPLENTLQVGGDPIINKKVVKTKLLVNNGETIVLGGIFEEKKESGEQGVPLLMDIPLIGYLFRHSSEKVSKQELLIFVTPTIVNEYKPEGS